jgi:cytochrome b561
MLEKLRAWASRHTEQDRYSPVGVAFHWVMALLVLFQLGWGFYADFLMPGGDKLHAYQVHGAVGLPILVLTFFRAAWRILIPGPVNDADRLGWQTTAAHVTHLLFYLCFLGLPLSGWVMWSSVAPPGPLRLAGVLPWPQVPLDQLPAETQFVALRAAERVHYWLIVLLLVLIPAHVGAALKHHFWDRHDVLRGMLPEIPDWEDPREEPQHKPREPRFRPETEVG